ncbi:MAG TPA: hypothetical protein VJQ54_25005 [Candidatus Sulfotelmatobacter sp.]|nr:hypothetical protein [Candidatus Sulfotelmatobacter sp.]
MGTVKALIGIFVIVGVLYSAWQIVPPELSNYSFQDDLQQIAMVGGANPHETGQQLAEAVMKKAQEHQIPLAPEQITVQRIGSPGAPAVYVAADYTIPVTLPGYSFTLHFTPSSGNRGF